MNVSYDFNDIVIRTMGVSEKNIYHPKGKSKAKSEHQPVDRMGLAYFQTKPEYEPWSKDGLSFLKGHGPGWSSGITRGPINLM